MAGRFWTVSNGLSILRLLLAIPIVLFLEQRTAGARISAGVLCLIAAASDFLDGWLARRLNEVTTAGKILDPIADKIAVALVAAFMTAQDLIPLWYFLAVVIRDVLILGGGLYLRGTRGTVLQSNIVGKWTVGTIALALFLALFLPDSARLAGLIVLWISTFMLLVSLGLYVRRFIAATGQTAPAS